MKRLSVFILAFFIIFTCCACKNINDTSLNSSTVESTIQQDIENLNSTTPTLPSTENSSTTNSTNSHTHNFVDATCTKPATCSCGATVGAAYGHSYSNGVCERCNQKVPNNSSKVTETVSDGPFVDFGENNESDSTTSIDSYYEKCSVRGNDLPHRYSEPTCIKGAICDFCGKDRADAYGHTINKNGVCYRCNETFTPINIEYPTPLVFEGVTKELVNFTYYTKSKEIVFEFKDISTTGDGKEFFVKMSLYNGNTKIASKTITRPEHIVSDSYYLLSSYITDDTTKIVLENIS